MYGEVFRKISLEDEEYMDVVVKAPEFGNSTGSYEEVIHCSVSTLCVDFVVVHLYIYNSDLLQFCPT